MKYNRIGVLAVLLLAVTLGGCMDVKNMTEEETDMVAEYAAGVLLRYSDTYRWRLITEEQKRAEEEAQGNAVLQPEASEDPGSAASRTEEPAGDNTGNTGNTGNAGNTGSTGNTGNSGGNGSQEASGGDGSDQAGSGKGSGIKNVSLNDFYRLRGIDVSLKGAKVCRRYKNIEVPAGGGERLFVVTLSLKNTSVSKRKVNLMKRDISYPLTIGKETYQLGINILEGYDMKYLNTSVASGKSIEAALVYTIPSSKKKVSSAQLAIQEAGRKAQVTCGLNVD